MGAPFAMIHLNPGASFPLYQQLYGEIRAAILAGRLTPGMRLPSTRTWAEELGISRNTVSNAFDQLIAEGYLESHVGDGTYVTTTLPDDQLVAKSDKTHVLPKRSGLRQLSQRGALLAKTPVGTPLFKGESFAFRAGVPALDQFPFELWARLEMRFWRNPPRELLTYSDPAGYRPLREAIAEYLGAARAVRCTPDQVILVSGSQQALDLAGRVLLDPGDSVWMEDPGYKGARSAMIASGAQLTCVPVDGEGLNVEAGTHLQPDARLVYVTPSHQYPLGITMSLTRRFALLEWAAQSGAWILEDDYDSEYRYSSRPLAALQGLDTENRVIYLGTFSKVLFPALRLGYLVVPDDLIDAFVAARALSDRHSPVPVQAVVAAFMEEGHFARHIRRMRTLYSERQQALIHEAHEKLAGVIEIEPAETGMHVLGWLPEGVNDEAFARTMREYQVDVTPLSAYCAAPYPRSALLLGYTSVNQSELERGIAQLAKGLSAFRL